MIIVRESKLKLVGLLAMTILFVVAGIWMATSARNAFYRGVGWVCAAFSGIGLIVLPLQLLSGSREVMVSAEGVSDSNWKLGTIPWSEVNEVWVATIKRTRF